MRFLALLVFGFSLSAHASLTVKTQIHDIDYGHEVGDEVFVLLKSGHVAWLKNGHNKSAAGVLELARHTGRWMNFTLNDQNELEHVEAATAPVTTEAFLPEALNSEEIYNPTVVENLEVAKGYFRESRYVNKESQCYNRAEVWSYEWFTKHNVYSNKTWIFFTRKYIRKFKFEWWFHVSPSMPVKESDGVIREKVMDVKYARGPLDLKRWTDIFMRDDANCPKVEKYSDYANYPESGTCYTMRTSMFYYQPFDIETRENWGTIKANWFEAEIKAAYLEAFDEEI